MNMMHRFVLIALVVAALAQPSFATQPMMEFELDNSTNPSAYEETLPTNEKTEVSASSVESKKPDPIKSTVPAAPVTSTPIAKKANPSAGALTPRDIPLIETQNDSIVNPEIRYVTGGIGEDEIHEIQAAKANYNLYVMSANEASSFIGDARVVIARKQGEAMEVVLDVVAGPLLYVALPAGSYTLSASLGAQSKRQAFVVKDQSTPHYIHLGWKSASAKPAH